MRALALAAMLAVTLVVTGTVLYTDEPGQVIVPNPQSYMAVDSIWPVLDLAASVSLPGYAFAQSVTLTLTAAGGIDNDDTLFLDGPRNIAIFESGGSTYAAVTSSNDDGVQILDITDPSAITAAGSINGTTNPLLDNARNIAIFESGDSTYAAVTSYNKHGVQILDITDPSAITAAGNITNTEALKLSGALDIAIFESGSSTYAAVTSYIDDGVQILDITDPFTITAAGSIHGTTNPLLNGAWGIAIFESVSNTSGSTYAVVTSSISDGVQILDITDPSAITAAGSINGTTNPLLNNARGIATFESGDSTYAAVTSYVGDGVQILNITDPSAITAADSINNTILAMNGAQDIAIFESGDSTYAAVTSYINHGVQILDITDPSAITAAGSITTTATLNMNGAWGIATFESGSSTYVAVATLTGDGVQIIKITDTSSPPDAVQPPEGSFVTTWETTTAGESITIPVNGATGNYTVHWGDGNVTTYVGDATHTYAEAGNHTVSISDDFTRIYLAGDSDNAVKLQSIEQWGNISWTTMTKAFQGASNMVYNATDAPSLSDVTDMSFMFASSSINGNLSIWDVSSVDDMSFMFEQASTFNGDISGWDVSSVDDMSYMFEQASIFNGDISGWDVSSVTDMQGMFDSASVFNGDISGWDVSSVTNMELMFRDLSNFDRDLSSWDVSKVTSMYLMFSSAISFNSDLSSWDVSKVTNMESMFYRAQTFDGDIPSWNVSSVTNMRSMFQGASSFAQNISGWDVSKVDNMDNMFTSASSFEQNLGNWYVVLAGTSIDADDAPGIVGTVSAQNLVLNNQSPTYDIGSGGDADSFSIVEGSSLNMTVTPTKSPYTVNITSTGVFGTGNHKILNIDVTGINDNTPPTLEAIGSKNVTESDPLTFTVRASDLDVGATLKFTLASGAPDGASITMGTGEFSWTPTEEQDGEHLITFVVTDNHNATDSETITVTVNDENSTPVLDSIGNRGVDELTELTFTAVASDSDYVSGVPDSLNFTLINTPPNGASIHLTTGVFSWTPTEEQDGEHLVTIEVMDNSNADNIATTAHSKAFTVTVAEVNDAPTLDMIGPKNATASMPLTFTATASDEDIIGGVADSLTFSLGSDDMTGANITSVGSFSWTPTATQAGEHTIRIQVTDSGNATAYEDVAVTVTGPTENLVAPPLEGSFVTTWETDFPSESIYIPVDGATGNYTVNWGDGAITTHIGDADHQYAAAGIYTVSISGNFTKIKTDYSTAQINCSR